MTPVRLGKVSDERWTMLCLETLKVASELGVHHDLSQSLTIGSDFPPTLYRQGKADREPADPRGSREP
jgi:hypothetical protein